MEKSIVSRSALKCNTICNCILRVDFMKIENIDNVLSNLIDFMNEKGYTFSTTDVFNVDISITDPDSLITQEMIKRNVNKTINNEFNNAECKFILNEYMLIFEKKSFLNYTGIDEYFNIFNEMLNIIFDIETNLKIIRVGLRKINNVFVKKTINFHDIFNSKILPDINQEKLTEYQIINKQVSDNAQASNAIIYIQQGKGKYKGDTIELFRMLWDIDCYSRESFAKEKDIKSLLIELNNNVFAMHKDIISETLINDILLKEYDEDLIESRGIYGGINKNI